MPDLEQKGQSDFLIEKIKVNPVNKRKLIRRMIITVSMAIIFGLVACVTFLLLEPVLSNWLYPEEEPPQTQPVEFPEDQEEMLPEDMLAENLPTESPGPQADTSQEETPGTRDEAGQEEDPEEKTVVLDEEQIRDILNRVTFDLEDYKALHAALSAYAAEVSRSVVTVTAVTSSSDWLIGVQENRYQCSGVIISENGMDLLILTDYSSITSAERLIVTFYDNSQAEAQLKQRNAATSLAVLSVPLANLSDTVNGETLPIVKFGYSSSRNLVGMPVVAVGSPMGASHSVGYGMVTSAGAILSVTDRNYRLLLTDISGSQNSSGALFDLQGQMIGFITNGKTGADMRNLIAAYGITELRTTMEKMSNASATAYLGLKGVDVPREANQELGMPFGAYVEAVEMDSPAMRAGIRRGDVVTDLGGRAVANFGAYSNFLMQLEPGQTVTVTVMRQAQDEYKKMEFSIELGEVR